MNLSRIFKLRVGAWILAVTVPGITLILLVAILTGGNLNKRTFLIEAKTTGIDIQFSGLSNAWLLGKVTLCTPLERINRSAPRGSSACDERRYLLQENETLLLEFPDKASATVMSGIAGELIITLKGSEIFPDNTRILVSKESWLSMGALAFSGYAVVGGPMGSGQQKILLSGRYEVRETSSFSFGKFNRTEVIKSGQLLRGEQVSITQNETPAPVVGHLTPSENDRGIETVIVSHPGNTALSLGYIGADQTSTIQPDWIDYAIASPTLVALTLVLSVFIGVGQLLFSVTGYLRRTKKINKKNSSHQSAKTLPEPKAENSDVPPDIPNK